ncbi:hypothetical protein JTE90_009847 [Oedothorax gibbosus]|uniref:Uncharacterized protein n=1 Tax=Oedothorax gibbosus TaxID=931172 RepID=A0AAV6TZS6_9ARAC|nr:hypothetical protein JTE90_009847 [Oedothorax gibbosus]
MATKNTNDEVNAPPTSQEVTYPSVLPRPRVGSDVLDRILNDDVLHLVKTYNNNHEVIQETIIKLYSYFEKKEKRKKYAGRVQDVVQNLLGRSREAIQVLLKRIDEWKPVREASIQKLTEYINKLDRNFKVSTIVRFVSSSVDVSGSVGGLLFQSEAAWATHALNAASFFGLCGLVSTVAEVEVSKRILDEVSDIIEKDRELMQPVLEWFEETGELDAAVEELFPHALNPSIVQSIQADAGDVSDNLQIFKALWLSNVKRDDTLWKNSDFLHSIQLFARSEVGQLWWKRIIYRKHPIIMDSGRMALQIEFGQIQSIIFQCIPALPLEQQRLTSLPVAGRIMLNLLTMYDSLADLNKGARSIHSDKMRRLVEKMSRELKAIDDTLDKVKTQLKKTAKAERTG